jgi:hypothetical protein
MAYATTTEVSVDKTRIDIEYTLRRYGANAFMYATQDSRAIIMFEMRGKRIRFVLELPDANERRFTHSAGRGIKRTYDAQHKEWEQACRSKWRSLLLVIKAKLEAVDAKISVLEQEFLSNIVLPNGQTVADFMIPQVERAYIEGAMPAMLPMIGGEVR